MKRSSLDIISEFTGIKSPDLRAIAAQVKANSEKLNSCLYHEFILKPGDEANAFGKHYVCTACGGDVDSHAFYWHDDGRRVRPV